MSIKSLERVMWRLRTKHPNNNKILNSDLKRAIMVECGTDPLTYTNNRKALITLGWIKHWTTKKVILTDKDLTGDY